MSHVDMALISIVSIITNDIQMLCQYPAHKGKCSVDPVD